MNSYLVYSVPENLQLTCGLIQSDSCLTLLRSLWGSQQLVSIDRYELEFNSGLQYSESTILMLVRTKV